MQNLKFAKPIAALVLLALAACGGGSDSFEPPPDEEPPPEPPSIGVDRVFTQLAFDQPLAMLQPPGDATRWFVVEKAGIVREFPNDPGAALGDVTVFADITDRVDSSPSEGGLLGMAFHPDFDANGEVYLSYTRSVGGLESVVSRFVIDSAGALDVDSEDIVLT
ncbi:MAG: PQQ-dependent sugar dehydrogenase, partial [Woeseiaceae bacterium]